MEQHWTETPSRKKLSSLLQGQLTQESEDITPAAFKGTLQMHEQMPGAVVH